MELLKQFYEEEDGMGVIEIVMIIAALMCVALIFKDTLIAFVKDLLQRVLNQGNSSTGGNVSGGSQF